MNLEEYSQNDKEGTSPGTLNHNTISRFILGSNYNLTIQNRNILAKCSKREYDETKDSKKYWLEAIKNLLTNINVSEEIKKNTIPDIISYIKSYVKHCINNNEDLAEFLKVLKGTNFNLKTLIDMIKEVNIDK